MSKLSNLTYGLIITVAVFMIFITFNTNLLISSGVAIPSADNQTMMTLTNIKNITDSANTIKGKTFDESQSKNWIEQAYYDIIGKYFEKGLAVIKLIPNMFGLFDDMITSIFGRIPIFGIALSPLSFLYIIGLLFIIIFAILSIVLGRDI